MLKKLSLLVIPFLLISCKEDNKLMLQDLLDKEDFITAKKLNQTMLDELPEDSYYQSVKGYILSVECLSTNCIKNNEGMLRDSIENILQNNGLLKVDDFFFVDLYAKTIINIIDSVLKQDSLEKASEVLTTLADPVKNKRIKFIYNYLFNKMLDAQLKGNNERVKYVLKILNNVDLKMTKEQLNLINLLNSLVNDDSLSIARENLKSINRLFVDKYLPGEILVSIAPMIANYVIDKNLGSIIEKFKAVNEIRGNLLGENVSVFKKDKNNEYFAKGIELLTESDHFIQKIAKYEKKSTEQTKVELQKISLAMNYDNDDLWKKYVKTIINDKNFSKLYKDFVIEKIKPEIIVFNNNSLLKYAEKNLKEDSIIPQIDEIVFREDSNKEDFKKRSIALVESALVYEMNQDNLERIFSYFTYFPDIKEKFKEQISQKIKTYIDNAWNINNFVLLDKLLKLDKEIESISINNVLKKLFDDQLNKKEVKNIFVANTVDEFLQIRSDDEQIYTDLKKKYDFIKLKIDRAYIKDMVVLISESLKGVYSKSKIIISFKDVFSKDEGKTFIMRHIDSILSSENDLSLDQIIQLSNYLIKELDTLSNDFIEKRIINKINNLDDLNFAWNYSSKSLKNSITKYDPDIKRLITIISNDNKNKKISAAVQMDKLKSEKVQKLASIYKDVYLSYIDDIKGYYVKLSGNEGPEVIHINPTKELLKVSIGFFSKLGSVEKLDKYKLDRGTVFSKIIKSYYEPTSSKIKIKDTNTKEEAKVFSKGESLEIKNNKLLFAGQEYEKITNLFEFNQKYGIVEQLTISSQDNFHLLPEGTWFKVVDKVGEYKYKYKIIIVHPANLKEVEVNAIYNPETLEFSFEYEYYISAVDRKFEVKAKCQLLGNKAYCAVQDKHWKREKYSVILKALEVIE